ncbi:hypothetical protein B9Z55_012904 [Caenorhabditis nigoni]|uniref:F-box domain-containing protein n=1 Tax=Caenorhabditis nigoni TaxID=1611254 RepID=A0A2G5TZJ2_9PELO|nr:hypothetical protein B9Z55_012904 [Caenorhabditis nigoni]
MASTLENLSIMTENLSMDPIYETNWCDMPEEIKLECIKKMGIKERLSMRCTAKAEKSFVDSQKFKFLWGQFHMSHFQLNLSWREPYIVKPFRNSIEAVEMTNYILKIGVFESASFYHRDLEAMNFTEPISAKFINFESCENKTVVDALRKLKDDVKSIEINAEGGINDYDFNEILAISHVQNVPYWHIADCYQADSLQKVAQIWIDVNSKIGTTFQVSRTWQGPRPSEFQRIFLEHFTDYIVSNTGKGVRIRTNNPDRHILLERGLDYNEDGDDEAEESYDQFYRLIVISAEMKESEYDNKCNKWICKIDYENFSENDDEQNIINGNHENIQNDDQVENRERNPDDEDDDDW